MNGDHAAPYLQIAAEIRRRIQTGELRPGDRVPSTRGLVRSSTSRWRPPRRRLPPSSRTAWSTRCPASARWSGHRREPRSRSVASGPPTNRLNREEVVRTAIAIADDGGPRGAVDAADRHRTRRLDDGALPVRRRQGRAGPADGGHRRSATSPCPRSVPRVGAKASRRPRGCSGRRTGGISGWPGAITLGRPQLLPNLLPHTDIVLRAAVRLRRRREHVPVRRDHGVRLRPRRRAESGARGPGRAGHRADG